MDSLRSQTTADLPPEAAAPGDASLVWTRIAQGAAMAAVVAVGVTALSLFPHPRPAAPLPVRVAAAPALALPLEAAPQAPPDLRPRIAPSPPPLVRRHPVVVARTTRPHAPAATVVVARAAQRPQEPCRAPTVADRLVCSEPALAAQDRRMRAAYARALAAGADRLEIDRGQARWHGARDRTTEPGQLAQLYARRIADLEAAAARPPHRRAPSGGQA
jgi:uncharacterized protein YecT (DUF1311 family)